MMTTSPITMHTAAIQMVLRRIMPIMPMSFTQISPIRPAKERKVRPSMLKTTIGPAGLRRLDSVGA